MEEVPLLKELHTKYASDLVILGISIDKGVEQTDRTVKEKGMMWRVLGDGRGFDGPNPTAYHVQGTPDLFVLDRAGRILARMSSAKQLEAKIQEALEQGR